MPVEILNTTPFVPLQFESFDAKRNHFVAVAVRGSFRIENGKRLELAEVQESLVLEDTYFGEPGKSSMRFDSGLSPYKPRTDLIIEATAFSPGGKPSPSWISQVDFGNKRKRLRITGPHHWESTARGFVASQPMPISSLDVRYEHAYGGTFRDGNPYPDNPLGMGLFDGDDANLAIPQILAADSDEFVFGQHLPVVGLGPIAPSWASRLKFAGSYDESWKATHAPYLPPDFNFEFYNVAHDDLKMEGFANGDEIIRLKNLYSKGDLSFGLPNIQMGNILRFDDGRIIPGPMNLDTIEVLVEQETVYLQWRGIFPGNLPIRQVELRLSAPQYLVEV